MGARLAPALGLITRSLSGRLLLLTLAYALVAEVLIFVPSVSHYYRELLDNHIESAELAVLPFTEPGGERLSAEVRSHLLMRAGAMSVLVQRPEAKELYQITGQPPRIDATVDLTHGSFFGNVFDAIHCLIAGGGRIVHVIAPTRISGAESIGIILAETPIRTQLLGYAERIVVTGLIVSLVTALLVFASLYLVLVRPMRRLTDGMVAFRDNPEDPSRIVAASGRRDEIGIAERELAAMQTDLYAFLQQKARLAALGSAVARIQHDLRNILATAQLASDRLGAIDDPAVKKLAPRLVGAIDRAISLATSTLRYGRAGDRVPQRKRLRLAPLVAEAGEAAIESRRTSIVIDLDNAVADDLLIEADPEHLYRILLNLLRNAVEALCERGMEGRIRVVAERARATVGIEIADNGPGIAEELRDRLFEPFASAGRSGGSGLGLAIARDLARGHGGDLRLVSTGAGGTTFRLEIPDRDD